MDDQLKVVHGGVAQTNTTTDSPGAPTTSSPFPKEDNTDRTTSSTSSCDCGGVVVTNAAAVDTVLSENGKDSEAKVSSFDVTSNNTTSCMSSNTVASTTLTTTTTTGSPSTFTASDTAGSDSSLDHRLSECNINKNEDGNDNVPDKNPLLEVGLGSMQPVMESNKAIMKNTTSNEMETSKKSDNANNHVSVNHPGSPDSGGVELTSAMQQQGKHEHSREQQPVIKQPPLSSDGRSTSQIAEQNTTQSWNKTSEAGMEESNNVERQLSRTTCPQAVPLETIPIPGDHEQSRITLNKNQTNVQANISQDGTLNEVSSKHKQMDNQSTAAISTAATLSSGEDTVDNSREINFMKPTDSPSHESSNSLKETNLDVNTSDANKTSLNLLDSADSNLDNVPGSKKQSSISDKSEICTTQRGDGWDNNSCCLTSNSSSELPLEKINTGGKCTNISPVDLQTEQNQQNIAISDLGANTHVQQQNSREASSLPQNEGHGVKVELSLAESDNDATAAHASASCEVPKRSERVISKTSLSLADSSKDVDDHLSKRSDTDSQDITPSESLSIPSDKDIDGIPIETADSENGQGLSKIALDGSSSVQSIYHIKWIHFQSQKVPIITQNENGPCPLLAIMNVLLLQGRVTLDSTSELITSEQLMDHLGECILQNVPKTASEADRLNYQQNMQDGMAVVHKLQTGLDVNVGFKGVQDFEITPEYIIFDLLGISLYHGWLVDPQSHEVVSAIGKCSYNQLVEKIIVQKNSDSNEQITEALIAETFLEKTASQLTYHGLCELNSTVKEGELCVFFRNNHFSTLYGHKVSCTEMIFWIFSFVR
ncbi:ubiquitin carboxyl-terminal hydrolase MINDY-1-like [Octopus vulgaris]|uniref:Ubiquitin carboxyl-terminal hydrolase MINDY-1-like n=1 Tax=Octopus vulgaris TaxID=6645 RepID=A0AA36F3S8_OCTVU|nr:ubiquitin carboxyl-terminal hydrolase MINDY-1-like [Octopus vulgaris]